MIEINNRKYYRSFDILRVICMVLIIIAEFGLYFIPYFSYAQPFLNFAVGTLFTVYGYIVLRDGTDLKKNIKHALKVFFILFAVYGVLTLVYYWLMTGSPFAGFTKRGIFNFVVLNYWGTSFCASIWYVQSTLYALIAFYLIKKFKKFDWLLCIILFVISILIGELAGVINFSVLGYTYIPGNFLTRTMPYMLLGRLLYKYQDIICKKLQYKFFLLFIIGLFVSVAEFLILGFTGKLVYTNHFIGFILMASALCLNASCITMNDGFISFTRFIPTIYKGMYYIYNPIGYIILIIAGVTCKTQAQYNAVYYLLGIIMPVLAIGISWLAGYIIELIKFKYNFSKMSKRF